MTELAIVAFTTFFITLGPVDVAFVFAAMSSHFGLRQRRRMAIRGTVIAALILLPILFFGEQALTYLGIGLPALEAAGGILLLLIGIDMVFARNSGGFMTTEEETLEARQRPDLSVFPLATPLIAGPGAMGAAVLLMTRAGGDWQAQMVVFGALVSVLMMTLVCLLVAVQIQRYLGATGAHVLTRVFGVLLCALAVQFIFDGIEKSGVVG